jgi:hypothetical protein
MDQSSVNNNGSTPVNFGLQQGNSSVIQQGMSSRQGHASVMPQAQQGAMQVSWRCIIMIFNISWDVSFVVIMHILTD